MRNPLVQQRHSALLKEGQGCGISGYFHLIFVPGFPKQNFYSFQGLPGLPVLPVLPGAQNFAAHTGSDDAIAPRVQITVRHP